MPVPDAPALIVIHAALLVAVHAHPAPAVTVTAPVPVVAATLADAGAIVGVQGTPFCVTVNVDPAIVSVPVRLVVPALAATAKVTVPAPTPAAPVLTVIQEALLTAVHVQPVPALTVVLPLPPAAASVWLTGEIVGAHGRLNANVFERALDVAPPGPIACTTVS